MGGAGDVKEPGKERPGHWKTMVSSSILHALAFEARHALGSETSLCFQRSFLLYPHNKNVCIYTLIPSLDYKFLSKR